MPHLLVSAAHKSSGKTTISIGLCAALRRRGLTVQPFKKGPDYIDPLWLTAAAGRPCRNLDFHTQGREEIERAFAKNMQDADIGLIEGNKGLYDGLDLDGSNSNAALAVQLGAPVVLVLDTRGMTRGVAPLILGYQAFEDDIDIAGVILNQVGGPRHETKLRRVIEHYTGAKVVGAVARDESLVIEERHLGLVPSNEMRHGDTQVAELADRLETQLDVDELIVIANRAAPVSEMPVDSERVRSVDLRIGYARDSAFGFYYQDDLEALERAGAQLVPFSPLVDQALPDVDGLFLGGGFPETHLDQLEANRGMRNALYEFIEHEGPAYAECGGLMLLCRAIEWRGHKADMAGVIPATAVMHERPQGRGYVELEEVPGQHPWPGLVDANIMAHEFHYSRLEGLPSDIRFAYRVNRGQGVDGKRDGIVHRNLLASYSHLRDTDLNHWASRFVAFVRERRRTETACSN